MGLPGGSQAGADTIWNATNAKVVFGGLSLDGDLEAISRLCGEHREETDAGEGKVRYERVRILPVDQLRTLPQVRRDDGRLVMFELLIHRSTPATIVRVHPVWERRDVRTAGRPTPAAPIDEVLRPVDPDQPQVTDRPRSGADEEPDTQ